MVTSDPTDRLLAYLKAMRDYPEMAIGVWPKTVLTALQLRL
ncbi:hypothetical protein MycrhDRAFT_4749 [Mycolicibacterium rhodesiae JS60]|nr:hypothetical protein MycrhDRAFT_4749 [Mycolicibacterium rhodesiae JS60]